MSSDDSPPESPAPARSPAEWLEACRTGDADAEESLFQHYFERLIRLARRRLSLRLGRRLDPEDVVLSAWRSFFLKVRAGQFAGIGTEGDLWPLLATLTLRKLSKQARRHQSERRNVERDVPLEASPQPMTATAEVETAAIIADEIEILLARLDATDQEILIQTLQGADAAAVAQDLGCSDRTVRRSLERIRVEAAALDVLEDPRPGPRPAPLAHRPPSDRGDFTPTHQENDITLQRLAGQGAFTKVYRAVDRISGETVAVKFLRRNGWRERRTVASLLGEYETLRFLRHDGIVGVHGWGTTRGGGTFLILEWIDGPDLNSWSHEHHSAGETLVVLRKIAEALGAAHTQGVIHGDLKPANVLRKADGRVILADFGLAWRTGRLADRSAIGGTAGFLAPELLKGGEPSTRSDIYSFGALGQSLLSGNRIPTSELDERIHDRIQKLLVECLNENLSQRPDGIENLIRRLRVAAQATTDSLDT